MVTTMFRLENVANSVNTAAVSFVCCCFRWCGFNETMEQSMKLLTKQKIITKLDLVTNLKMVAKKKGFKRLGASVWLLSLYSMNKSLLSLM